MRQGLFHFTVESTGSLRPEEIVRRGVEVLKRKIADIRANLKSSAEDMQRDAMAM